MLILAIESSCDETSAAVVESTEGVLSIKSNIIASQIERHALFGGVVPEIASRCHTEAVSRITYEALERSGASVSDIDIVGVTNRPGLIGALLVGLNFAKGLACSYDLPLVPVHHIRGHIAANYFSSPAPKPPFLALAVSGGHTSLILFKSYTECETIGRTRDDAAGEAFDKAGRLIGLPYPGGAAMDKLAYEGDPEAIKLPSAAIPDGSLDFSFSGIKTAVINYINTLNQKGEELPRADIAASFTQAAVSSVIKKLGAALDRTGMCRLAVAGGVAANSHLRRALEELSEKRGIELFIPPASLCGDNAAMIGAQAYYEYLAGNTADASLNAYAAHI
ncbi:MAG: tRNA (adenosine(37)-N6)-threonylcarbamoyltransferase complex transferase subunit TsaD [Firmicutes bacterium]|nr:tRNA (adenosine(37)-N6)-threonylcarbamoyltransferase complex transferase subunit TsaD [Bacillota bacterium]